MESLSGDIEEVLFSQEQIAQVVGELGARITDDYAGKNPLLISVLRGGVVFMSDLVRRIDLPIALDFMAIASYGPETRDMGVVQVIKDLDDAITDKDVIIVEDVIDTGLTLNYLMTNLKARRPRSLSVCALLDRTVRRIADIEVKYKGFDLPDVFVVGYGLDFKEQYRNLPFVGILKESAYGDDDLDSV